MSRSKILHNILNTKLIVFLLRYRKRKKKKKEKMKKEKKKAISPPNPPPQSPPCLRKEPPKHTQILHPEQHGSLPFIHSPQGNFPFAAGSGAGGTGGG